MRGTHVLASMLLALVAQGLVIIPQEASPNICARNSTIGEAVIRAVNISWPGLEAVSSAVAANDTGAACAALVAYYQGANTSSWLRKRKGWVKACERATPEHNLTQFGLGLGGGNHVQLSDHFGISRKGRLKELLGRLERQG
jgi:hypothetical protein